MNIIYASGFFNLTAFIAAYNLSSHKIVDISIGNDEMVYCLLAENVPERINGMFVPTTNHSKYIALSFAVDWHSGKIFASNKFDFGLQSINIHFIQPMGNLFLLLGSRAKLYKDGSVDSNALIVDSSGNMVNSFCLGDGINNCIVDRQNKIITSYFDEGVFGNNGWVNPVGACGLIKWSETGEKLWENVDHNIYDCYAINIDDEDNLWFCYYSDFDLVRTDYQSEIIFKPSIEGSRGFLISPSQNGLLFHKGYGKNDFCVMEMISNKLSTPIDCKIAFKGTNIDAEYFAFRGSKAVMASKRNLYFLNWTNS